MLQAAATSTAPGRVQAALVRPHPAVHGGQIRSQEGVSRTWPCTSASRSAQDSKRQSKKSSGETSLVGRPVVFIGSTAATGVASWCLDLSYGGRFRETQWRFTRPEGYRIASASGLIAARRQSIHRISPEPCLAHPSISPLSSPAAIQWSARR
jgi:hypothetical protein